MLLGWDTPSGTAAVGVLKFCSCAAISQVPFQNQWAPFVGASRRVRVHPVILACGFKHVLPEAISHVRESSVSPVHQYTEQPRKSVLTVHKYPRLLLSLSLFLNICIYTI